MNIGELFVDLGFDVDDKKLKEFNQSIKDGAGEMLKMSAIATGAVYALNAFFENSGQKAVAFRQFTMETGFASEALQKWQTLIHLTNPNVGIEEAANGYKKLAQTLIDIRQGKGNSGALAMLGVTYDTNMTPEKVLEQVAAHAQEVIKQNGVGFFTDKLNSIGIGAGAINALMLSAQQRDQMTSGLILSPEQLQRLVQYQVAIADLTTKFEYFKTVVAADYSEGFLAFIREGLVDLGEFIKNFKVVYEFLSQYREQIQVISLALTPLLASMAIAEFPITSAFLAMAFAINEVGKALRGLPTFTGKFLDIEGKGLDVLHHDPMQFLKNMGAAVDIPMRKLGVTQWLQSTMKNPPPQITNNVTQHITTSDPKGAANEAVRLLQNQNNSAVQQIDQGPRY